MPSFDLEQAAFAFAYELQDLLDRVLPGERDITAVRRQYRYVVHPADPHRDTVPVPIPLTVGGAKLASLRLSFRCQLDHQQRYLAIEKSQFALDSAISREPLVRLEYLRQAHTAPSAHWQVHAERGAFSALLAQAGRSNPHQLASLHLPVGGARMRPCLEDFLEFLISECGVDGCHGWEEAIREGRARWRRGQAAALVRDAPEDAIRVLEENDYSVHRPDTGGLLENTDRLSQW